MPASRMTTYKMPASLMTQAPKYCEKKTQQIRHSSIYACVKTLNPCCHGYDSMVSKPKLLYEEVNCKTASDILPVSHFLFSIKSMNRFDFIICWFSLYIIAEKSIKIFFFEIELGNK